MKKLDLNYILYKNTKLTHKITRILENHINLNAFLPLLYNKNTYIKYKNVNQKLNNTKKGLF